VLGGSRSGALPSEDTSSVLGEHVADACDQYTEQERSIPASAPNGQDRSKVPSLSPTRREWRRLEI
jgi:hypothetical protein